MRFEQVGQSFVAEVTGVDVTKIGDREFLALYEAWLEFGVLKIRDQPLTCLLYTSPSPRDRG